MGQNSKNYVFYDLETSGLSKQFDQILQFGGVLTDSELNEVDRFEMRCQLQEHIVPSPMALQITGVSPSSLIDNSVPTHYEALCSIYKKLSDWSPAVFLGYNSISFDEEMLRQAFYQTLQPCYLTNTNGNTRGDILRLLHAVNLLAPDVIEPIHDDKGRARFKLDQLAPKNGFAHQQAHDAMADVEATMHLAKLVLDEAPHVWDMLLATTSKKSVQEMIASHDVLMLCGGGRGGGVMSSTVVTACGINPLLQNQHGVFDLNHDPANYIDLTVEELRKEIAGNESPIQMVYTNRQPILIPVDDTPGHLLSDEVAPEEQFEKARLVQENTDFRLRVSEAMADDSANHDEVLDEVELQIYNGFASNGDSSLMGKFHKVDWPDRIEILRSLEDTRMKRIAQRLIYFERPNLLSSKVQTNMRDKIKARLTTSEDVPWRTFDVATAELERISAMANNEQRKSFVKACESFLVSRR